MIIKNKQASIDKRLERILSNAPNEKTREDMLDMLPLLNAIAIEFYDLAQSDLLESSSEGFDDYFSKYANESNLHHEFDAFQFWQACSIYHAKLIKEKDERIKELENELRNFERAELIQTNREDVLPAIQEAAYYNWLDDQVHEKDQLIFNLEEKYQEAVKDIETLLTLIDEGCLVYDQHVPSGSSSFRSDAECERLRLKSKYGLDKQESRV